MNDPSGRSLTLTDAEGDTAWQVVYDGYGAVLTGTMPVTLTHTLLDMPDGTTGLVYQGNGRYYDPALGRPLQPNPAGAPPTVPQMLNRYAAASNGQPGVFQAAVQSGSLLSSIYQSFTSNSIEEVLANKVIEPKIASIVNAFSQSSWQWLEITVKDHVSRGAVRRGTAQLVDAGLLTETARYQIIGQGSWRGVSRFGPDRFLDFTRTLSIRNRILGAEANSFMRRVAGFGISYSRHGYRYNITIGSLVPGAIADFFVGGIWQGAEDYLTTDLWSTDPALAWTRVGAGAVSNAATGTLAAVATVGAASLFGWNPLSWPVLGLGLIVGVVFDRSFIGQSIQNTVYQIFDADYVPARNLAPLRQ